MFGSSLLCETEQKDKQEEAIYFHDVISSSNIHIVRHTKYQCSTLQYPKSNFNWISPPLLLMLFIAWCCVKLGICRTMLLLFSLTKYGLVICQLLCFVLKLVSIHTLNHNSAMWLTKHKSDWLPTSFTKVYSQEM